MSAFDDIKTRADNLVASCAERDKMFRELEDMYLLKDSDIPDKEWVRETICPDPRNELIGAQRLLSAADPEFRVPSEMNEIASSARDSKVELYSKAIYQASNRAQRKPIHMEGALTGLLYGELAIAVRSTKDIAELAPPEGKKRLEHMSKKAPFLFDIISPTVGYPLFDEYGLAAYLIKQTKKVVEVKSLLGKEADKILKGKKDTDTVDYNEWWDLENHCVWVNGEQVLLKPHELPFIPISCQIIEGSELFMRSGQQTRHPFLYATWKSNMWKAANLAYTYTFTKIGAMGMTAQNVFHTDQDTTPTIDWTTPFGMAILKPNEKLEPYMPNMVDPQIDKAIQLAEQKITESTVYRQALGEPLGANAPFSMVSLLSQSGRLPLVPYQRMLSDVLANAMYMALYMVKNENMADLQAYADSGIVVIDPEEIPEVFEIGCNLEISMPTDERQNAVIATQLVGGKLSSKAHVQEKYLGIKQPDIEQQRMWYEELAEANHQITMQAQMMQMQQQAQAQQQAQSQQIQMQGQADQMAMQQQAQMQQQMPQQPMPMVSGMSENLVPGMPAPGNIPPEMMGELGMPAQDQSGAGMGLPGVPLGSPVTPPNEQGM